MISSHLNTFVLANSVSLVIVETEVFSRFSLRITHIHHIIVLKEQYFWHKTSSRTNNSVFIAFSNKVNHITEVLQFYVYIIFGWKHSDVKVIATTAINSTNIENVLLHRKMEIV